MLIPCKSSQPALWVSSRLGDFSRQVTSFVPKGFENYLRVPHLDSEGDLPPTIAKQLVSALAQTTSDSQYFFSIWNGFGGLKVKGALFEVPGRDLSLYTGSIEDAVAGFQYKVKKRYAGSRPGGFFMWRQSANLWWPSNHAWCVATDIDLSSTYIGCDAQTAQAIMAVIPDASEVSPDAEVHRETHIPG